MDVFEALQWKALRKELYQYGTELAHYEQKVINLIASDNALTKECTHNPPYPGNMIQEGLLENRPFAGARLHDKIERLAANAACKIFRRIMQISSLIPAVRRTKQCTMHCLDQRIVVLAFDFKAGGHLTHGLKLNFSGRTYNFAFYGLGQDGLMITVVLLL